ncbi:MAG: dihydrodipicolinate synthase family protein [Phycisphaeraceae bacterium]|nr:dihydrodipicolinate synthase family protein [Phycisphaeraceae bacterium]
MDAKAKKQLDKGIVIPAHPLALDANRKLDERRQRALSRYYIDSGAGGLAVGVHTTQFQIRDPKIGLFKPVLELASEEMDRADSKRDAPMVRIAGIAGQTAQAVHEAQLLADLGYHAGLLSLSAMKDADLTRLITHCKTVADVIPLVGFYLQPAVGGVVLPYSFWREFVEIPNVVAVKMAPFNRYQTIDVIRAVIASGREDIALYTGNDDNIVMDLLTPHTFMVNGKPVTRRIVGGLLGHWSVWTHKAVTLLDECHQLVDADGTVPAQMMQRAIEVTDSNAAFFDAANHYHGVIAGLHEVLRRQGLLAGTWCLDEHETLGPGQADEIDRVYQAYPHLHDDAFVAAHLDQWLSG